MQVRARDSTAYYSCDDHFVVVDKAVDCGRRGPGSDKTSLEPKDQGRLSNGTATSSSLGTDALVHLKFFKMRTLVFWFVFH